MNKGIRDKNMSYQGSLNVRTWLTLFSLSDIVCPSEVRKEVKFRGTDRCSYGQGVTTDLFNY